MNQSEPTTALNRMASVGSPPTGQVKANDDASEILFIDQTGQLGGAELCLLDIVSEFNETSRVVLFQDGPFRGRLEEVGVDVVVCEADLDKFRRSGGILEMLPAVSTLVKLIAGLLRESKKNDLLYANTQKAAVVAFVAGILGGRRTVWHLHDIITSSHFGKMNRRILIALTNLACSHVIANSQASLKAFRQAGGKVPTTVIYNGIDGSRFVAGEESPQFWRKELGINEKPTVGIFGRLAEWKGQLTFVEALGKCEGVQGIIVGGALFGGDEAYAKLVKSRVSELGLEDRISFLGFRDDVPQLMAACDAVVHASTDPEPFGRVIAEAMLCHRPVIAARGGGATELVGENDERGILVDAGDAAQLQSAIHRLLHSAEVREEYVPKALAFATEKFSPDKIAVEIRTILNETVGGEF